jgi:hypothetical protein
LTHGRGATLGYGPLLQVAKFDWRKGHLTQLINYVEMVHVSDGLSARRTQPTITRDDDGWRLVCSIDGRDEELERCLQTN